MLGIIAFLAFIIFFLSGSIHKIEEGHIGLYWVGGALQPGYTEPGFHLMKPLITSYANVQVSVQTDRVENIPCGTSGGVMIYFDKIEVVNRLNKELAWGTIKNYTINYDRTWIFDKIHHEINQFCSRHTLQDVYINKFDSLDESLVQALQIDCDKWAPGIQIIAVRVTKPRIPENIRANYESMESEKTKYLIAFEKAKILEKEAETIRMQNIIKAKSDAEVSKIVKEKEINEHEAKKTIQEIESNKKFLSIDEIYMAKQKAFTDAEHYKITREIEANNQKLTPEYLRYMSIIHLSNNTKFYFGESLPKYFSSNFDQNYAINNK